MGVIKRADAETIARDAVVLDLADIAQQAEVIRAKALREAERIVAEAQHERDRLIADAREVGHAAGREEGLRTGRSEGEKSGRAVAEAEHGDRLSQLEVGWSVALEEFVASRDHMVIACKQDVLRMVLAIAKRVVHRTIAADESVVADQIESVLRMVARPTRVIVAVHPGDATLAAECLPAIVSRIRAIEHADLVEDDSLTSGSVVITTAAGGRIDASIETQFERIATMLVPGTESASALAPVENALEGENQAADDHGDIAA